jgi:hypothetical protein
MAGGRCVRPPPLPSSSHPASKKMLVVDFNMFQHIQ